MLGQFVAYYRVSTDRQGRSGLGLEAQQKAVRDYLSGGNIVAEFIEIETGKRNDRPELDKALAECRRHKAKLVIAKLDRLSRNLAFIAALLDAGVEFIAVDNPHANSRADQSDNSAERLRPPVRRPQQDADAVSGAFAVVESEEPVA
jgi:DNA invertase Pin-like site-specific DNA recombinase